MGVSSLSGKQVSGLFRDPQVIGRTKDGLNLKFHTVYKRQMNDYKGAAPMVDAFRAPRPCFATVALMMSGSARGLAERISSRHPVKSNRKTPISHDIMLYRQRHQRVRHQHSRNRHHRAQ